jgi:hypothetical protein
MCEHGRQAPHNGEQDDPNIRPKQLRNREVPWEGSHRSKLMSRRTERSYQADGTDKLAPHSEVPCLVPEVNDPVAQQEFTFLLREICASGPAATPGAAVREERRGNAEVSRSHSTGSYEPGHTPDGLTTREGLNLADSTTTAERRLARKPNGGAASRVRVAERECCFILRDCQEPPDADPHVRWCGGREGKPPGYPIRRLVMVHTS